MNLFKKPYLVQRGEIRKNPRAAEGEKISSAIEFDYMGSSEFEWGALPASGKRMVVRELKLSVFNDFKNSQEQSLRLLSSFSDEQVNTYLGYLRKMYDEEYPADIHLKERTCFYKDYYKGTRTTFLTKAEFWWDIQNDCIWSFDKKLMGNLKGHLEASYLKPAEPQGSA